MNTVWEALQQVVPSDRIQRNAMLAPFTTFQIGGPADLLVLPHSVQELQDCMHVLSDHGIEPFVLGLGSHPRWWYAWCRSLFERIARGATPQRYNDYYEFWVYFERSVRIRST